MNVVCGTDGGEKTWFLVGKPEGKRPLVRTKRKCDDIKVNVKQIGWHRMGRIDLADDRVKWQRVVHTVMNLQDQYKAGNFLTIWRTVNFSKTLIHGIYQFSQNDRTGVRKQYHILVTFFVNVWKQEEKSHVLIWWGSGWFSQYSDWLRAGRSGDRIPVGARFFAHVQTGPAAHPASCTVGTRSFPGVKRPGRGADHPPPSSTEVTNE
jgi:hypothetical protein